MITFIRALKSKIQADEMKFLKSTVGKTRLYIVKVRRKIKSATFMVI
jgi:hypothetical protein